MFIPELRFQDSTDIYKPPAGSLTSAKRGEFPPLWIWMSWETPAKEREEAEKDSSSF